MKTTKYTRCRGCHTVEKIEVDEIQTSDELARQIADLLAGNYALDYRSGHRSTAYPSTPLGDLVKRYVSVAAIESTRGSK